MDTSTILTLVFSIGSMIGAFCFMIYLVLNPNIK